MLCPTNKLEAAKTPTVVEMIEDLLTPDAGFAIAERDVTTKEVGGSARHLPDIVLGVVGAFVGGFLFNQFGAAGVTGLNVYSLVVAVIGAIVVLVLYHLVVRGSTR